VGPLVEIVVESEALEAKTGGGAYNCQARRGILPSSRKQEIARSERENAERNVNDDLGQNVDRSLMRIKKRPGGGGWGKRILREEKNCHLF